MKRIIQSLLLLLLIPFMSCHRQQGREIHSIWGYIKEKPDSAVVILDRYGLDDFPDGRERAEFALLKSMAFDKTFRDITSDSLASVACRYYEKYGPQKHRMLSWYYLSRVQDNAKDFNNAIVSLARARELLPKANEPYYKGLVHMEAANIYNQTLNNTEALNESILGEKAFKEIGENRQAIIASVRVGNNYFALKALSKADSVFLSVINNPEADTTSIGLAMSIYAKSQALQDNYAESVDLFKKSSTVFRHPITLKQAGAYAYALYMTGEDSQSESIMRTLSAIPAAKETYLQYGYLISKKKKDLAEAIDKLEDLVEYQDSVVNLTIEQSIIKTQREYQSQNSELYRLKSEQRLGVIALMSVCFTMLLILFLAFTSNMALKRRQKEESLIAAYEDMSSQLKSADSRNETLQEELRKAREQYISVYKKKFTKIARIAETYYSTSGMKNSREKVYKEVQDLAGFISTDLRTYRQLEKDVNSNLSDAMTLFRMEIPISEEEYRFACYQMAGFPASTISLLTGISTANVYVKKNRLVNDLRTKECPHKDLFILALTR